MSPTGFTANKMLFSEGETKQMQSRVRVGGVERPVSPLTAVGGSGPSFSSAPPENPPEQKTKQKLFLKLQQRRATTRGRQTIQTS